MIRDPQFQNNKGEQLYVSVQADLIHLQKSIEGLIALQDKMFENLESE